MSEELKTSVNIVIGSGTIIASKSTIELSINYKYPPQKLKDCQPNICTLCGRTGRSEESSDDHAEQSSIKKFELERNYGWLYCKVCEVHRDHCGFSAMNYAIRLHIGTIGSIPLHWVFKDQTKDGCTLKFYRHSKQTVWTGFIEKNGFTDRCLVYDAKTNQYFLQVGFIEQNGKVVQRLVSLANLFHHNPPGFYRAFMDCKNLLGTDNPNLHVRFKELGIFIQKRFAAANQLARSQKDGVFEC